MNKFNGSHQKYIQKIQRIFAAQGWEKVSSESTSHGEFLLFTQNEAMHLVYCLPCDLYVTTMEVQDCWEAQGRFHAASSSVIAPHGFSESAFDKAWKLDIELLRV